MDSYAQDVMKRLGINIGNSDLDDRGLLALMEAIGSPKHEQEALFLHIISKPVPSKPVVPWKYRVNESLLHPSRRSKVVEKAGDPSDNFYESAPPAALVFTLAIPFEEVSRNVQLVSTEDENQIPPVLLTIATEAIDNPSIPSITTELASDLITATNRVSPHVPIESVTETCATPTFEELLAALDVQRPSYLEEPKYAPLPNYSDEVVLLPEVKTISNDPPLKRELDLVRPLMDIFDQANPYASKLIPYCYEFEAIRFFSSDNVYYIYYAPFGFVSQIPLLRERFNDTCPIYLVYEQPPDNPVTIKWLADQEIYCVSPRDLGYVRNAGIYVGFYCTNHPKRRLEKTLEIFGYTYASQPAFTIENPHIIDLGYCADRGRYFGRTLYYGPNYIRNRVPFSGFMHGGTIIPVEKQSLFSPFKYDEEYWLRIPNYNSGLTFTPIPLKPLNFAQQYDLELSRQPISAYIHMDDESFVNIYFENGCDIYVEDFSQNMWFQAKFAHPWKYRRFLGLFDGVQYKIISEYLGDQVDYTDFAFDYLKAFRFLPQILPAKWKIMKEYISNGIGLRHGKIVQWSAPSGRTKPKEFITRFLPLHHDPDGGFNFPTCRPITLFDVFRRQGGQWSNCVDSRHKPVVIGLMLLLCLTRFKAPNYSRYHFRRFVEYVVGNFSIFQEAYHTPGRGMRYLIFR